MSGVWLTIGSFDGVHRGHQVLVEQLVKEARAEASPAVVLTFFPHPVIVLRGPQGPFYLTTPEKRAALLGNLGVDAVITLPFDKNLAAVTAEEFMRLLKEKLDLRCLLVGYNFTLGRGRQGDVPTLQMLGKKLGYTLKVVEPVEIAHLTVSSSQIRAWLDEGSVDQVARGLGRFYSIEGAVVHGDGRGRLLGIPTANIAAWEEQLLPANGVYACWVGLGDQRFRAVVNIGFRPTFENQPALPRVEAHLLDFDHDLYNASLSLEFVQRLRGEQKFPSIDALLAQIHQDIQTARRIL